MFAERLQFLDSTLSRIIQRFEDEYPECRVEKSAAVASTEDLSLETISEPGSLQSSSIFTDPFANGKELPNEGTALDDVIDDDEDTPHRIPLSRHDSDVSLASRQLANEEGRMHRIGQQVRRDILRPSTTAPAEDDDKDSLEMARFREKVEALSGNEIAEKYNRLGAEGVLAELNATTRELRKLQEEDPKEFEKFREAQMHAQRNMGASVVNGDAEAHAGHGHGNDVAVM